jgi:hypothetical protein
MIDIDNIITGEKLQETADVYLGYEEDFQFNPRISAQFEKCLSFDKFYNEKTYDNPRIVFCYSHRLEILLNKINLFNNEFILITHNSDGNIVNNETTSRLLNNPKIYKWYGQNVCIHHDKLKFLPIGMANSQWAHGNKQFFSDTFKIANLHKNKTEKVYFNFNISTNANKRFACYDKLSNRIPFLGTVSPIDYHCSLSKYEFCICPEGNGVDTHRFWEALYLKSIPIVLRNPFIEVLLKQTNIEMVVLDDWNDLDIKSLDYSKYNFDDEEYHKYLKLQNYTKEIHDNKL